MTNQKLEITRLSGEFPFFLVEELREEGGAAYFGGSQSWLSTENGRLGGCGTVAAANILICLTLKQGEDFRQLYPYPIRDKAAFVPYLEEVYRVVRPIPLTALRDRLPLTFRRWILPSLGIPGIRFFASRVTCFAAKKQINLKPVWLDRKERPVYNTSLKMNAGGAAGYIRAGLRAGCPVALINAWNPALKKITHPLNESDSRQVTSDFQRHWVTVTAMKEACDRGKILLEVSSWGSRAVLNLTDFWGKGYSGLVYFRKDEGQKKR